MATNRIIGVLLGSSLILSLAACGGETPVTTISSPGINVVTPSGEGGDTQHEAQLMAIIISPADPQIARDTQVKFTATGVYSDNSTKDLTNSVTWSSSDPSIAEINADAVTTALNTTATVFRSTDAAYETVYRAKGKAVGKTTIKGSSGSVTGTTTLTVSSATLLSLAVTPSNPSIAAGTTQQFAVIGTFSDNTTQDLTATATWSASDSTIATIGMSGAAGLATAVGAGIVTITSASEGISGTATLTVTVAEPVSGVPTLSWDAPTTYTDGSLIAPGDIKGYKIYVRTSGGAYSPAEYYFVSPSVTSVALSDLQLAPGTYSFVVTTLDATDVESDFSNEASKSII